MVTTTDAAGAPRAGEGVVGAELVAQDAAAAEALMRGTYAEVTYRLHRPDGTDEPHLVLEGVAAGGLRSGRLRCGPAADVEAGPSEDVVTSLLLAGSLSAATTGGPLLPVRPGEVLTCVTGSGMRAAYGEGAAFGMLRLPRRAVETAAEAAGLAEGAALRILSTGPLDEAAGHYWRQLMAFTHRQLTAPGSPMGHPLYADHWQQSLAAAVLRVFPNTTMTSAVDGAASAGAVGPATLRRALAHAEAHAHEPIGVADLAEAAGVGVRALQLAFTAHLGTTPTAHLRDIRLRRAHAELRASVPVPSSAEHPGATTVAAVAARWGFTSPSAFATAYRRVHGCSPSDTLRG
ncbi:AraC family transcriptional regulator [Quadrisphaera sp. INWT6]|uniref:AraC family transcriptional regulator n=1 Tax=Quadrisphaera sp. INWT6 TaxID=2596917 RepID=UPI0018924082|nr:AraC family transcriptional regulator [Quadrisphaera sp. INWT6]MBF5082421.1 AraC family transcriptional regulator [Quadrisphaera sp. INWT6]